MKGLKPHLKTIGLFTVVFNIIIISLFSTNVRAYSDDEAIAEAPDGLLIDKYFTVTNPLTAVGEDNIFNQNSSQITNNKILTLATDKNTYGAIWSDNDSATSQNYLDVTKKQTISAWLYFGPGGNVDDVSNGQGMALVFQNDARGTSAIGAAHDGLGVYGYDKSSTFALSATDADLNYIQKSAVNNSIAIEFDTERNDLTRSNLKDGIQKIYNKNILNPTFYLLNGYDTKNDQISIPAGYPANTALGAGGSFGHIAVTYPGDSHSYAFSNKLANSNNADLYKPFTNAYSLFHIDATGASLVDDTDANGKDFYWHHITVTWNPTGDGKSSNISYSFNDKSIDGTINNNKTETNFIRIDKTVKVDLAELNLKSGETKIHWGFTGANSNYNGVAKKMVIFESIPALLDASAKTTITDTDLGKVITDDSTDRTVAHGTNLAINYHLSYDEGRTNWESIAAKITLPKNVIYNTDTTKSVATIKYTYLDGHTAIENIDTAELLNSVIQHNLKQKLGNIDGNEIMTADITVNGIADNTTDKDITVSPKPAVFTGTNDIESTSTPKFIIKNKKTWSLFLNKSDSINLVYQQADSLNLPTEMHYNDYHDFSTAASDNQIRYKISVAGKTYTGSDSVTTAISNFNGSIPLKDIIDSDPSVSFWNIFKENTTVKVTVIALDSDGISSNPVEYNINVLPNNLVEVDASPTLEFQDVNYLNTTKYLKRKTVFNLKVTSQRNPWQLSVSSTGLFIDNERFNGNIIYKKDDTSSQVLGTDPLPIESDANSYTQKTADIISNDWQNDTGLLLEPTGQSQAGHYNGTLTWTVGDYPS